MFYTLYSWMVFCLALLAASASGQDPTSSVTAYPAQTIMGCGGSPYTITAQAWQISTCVYTVKYTVQGTPALSDFGFGLGNQVELSGTSTARLVNVSGCAASWASSGGNGNSCSTHGPYLTWQADGGLVKINSECNENATFWITAQYASLTTNGTMAFKGRTSCWTCDNVPYVLANRTDPGECPVPSSSSSSTSASPSPSDAPPSPTPSPASSPSPSPSPSDAPPLPTPLPTNSPSLSPSGTPSSPAYSQSTSPSPSLSPSNYPSSSSSPTPSQFPFPSFSPSTSASNMPSSSPSPSDAPPSLTNSPSVSPSVTNVPSASPSDVPPSASPSSLSSTIPSSSPSTIVSLSPSPSSFHSNSTAGGGGGSTNAGAIAGGVVGGLAGLAGLAGMAGLVAGAGYLLYRWVNRPTTMHVPASALDSTEAVAVGDNALFHHTNVMHPNDLYVDGV